MRIDWVQGGTASANMAQPGRGPPAEARREDGGQYALALILHCSFPEPAATGRQAKASQESGRRPISQSGAKGTWLRSMADSTPWSSIPIVAFHSLQPTSRQAEASQAVRQSGTKPGTQSEGQAIADSMSSFWFSSVAFHSLQPTSHQAEASQAVSQSGRQAGSQARSQGGQAIADSTLSPSFLSVSFPQQQANKHRCITCSQADGQVVSQ